MLLEYNIIATINTLLVYCMFCLTLTVYELSLLLRTKLHFTVLVHTVGNDSDEGVTEAATQMEDQASFKL